jgi:hypothetical protein
MKIHILAAILAAAHLYETAAFTPPFGFSKSLASTTHLSTSSLESPPKPRLPTDDDDDDKGYGNSKNVHASSEPSPPSSPSLRERFASSSVASAAAVATAAVNAAVSMKTLEAPSVQKSYIAINRNNTAVDNEGLPLVYDKDLIERYWSKERGALNQRWVSQAQPGLLGSPTRAHAHT